MLTLVVATRTPGANPGEKLAGLSLALRTVLAVQKAGATRIVLLTDAEDADLARSIINDSRTRVPVEHRSRGAEAHPLEAALADLTTPALVARHDVVVSPEAYRALMAGPAGTVARCRSAGGTGAVDGPFLVSPDLGAAAADGPASLDAAIESLVSRGLLQPLELAVWGERLTGPAQRQQVVRALFEDCRKPVDGIVARHLNRHVSIFISKRIVDTPITPNMMSAFTFVLGVLAGLSVARGGYLPTLLGAFLWQWNSILDGVDGELARVRFQHSRLGQWIDTVSDDATNVIFWSGLAVGAAPLSRWLALSGWVAAGSNFLVAIIYYVELVAIGSGDVYDIGWDLDKKPPTGLIGKIAVACRYILKKDFFILFCLVLSAFGALYFMLPVVGAFGFGLLVAAVLRAIKRGSRARPPS